MQYNSVHPRKSRPIKEHKYNIRIRIPKHSFRYVFHHELFYTNCANFSERKHLSSQQAVIDETYPWATFFQDHDIQSRLDAYKEDDLTCHLSLRSTFKAFIRMCRSDFEKLIKLHFPLREKPTNRGNNFIRKLWVVVYYVRPPVPISFSWPPCLHRGRQN